MYRKQNNCVFAWHHNTKEKDTSHILWKDLFSSCSGMNSHHCYPNGPRNISNCHLKIRVICLKVCKKKQNISKKQYAQNVLLWSEYKDHGSLLNVLWVLSLRFFSTRHDWYQTESTKLNVPSTKYWVFLRTSSEHFFGPVMGCSNVL